MPKKKKQEPRVTQLKRRIANAKAKGKDSVWQEAQAELLVELGYNSAVLKRAAFLFDQAPNPV